MVFKSLVFILIFILASCSSADFDDDMKKFGIFNQGGFSYKDIKTLLQKFQGGNPLDKNKQTDPSQYGFTNDDSELSRNLKFLDDVFQGDIILSMQQAKILLQGGMDKLTNVLNPSSNSPTSLLIPSTRNKRKVIKDTKALWPTNIISYGFDSSIKDKKRTLILAGIKHWEDNTCLKFQEKKSGDYMLFVSGAGCYSTVGRVGGKQEVSLGDGCELLGIVAHEIGHVLGFWHEHSRPDRDRYIRINLANVIKLQEVNFNKLPPSYVNDYGVAYDLGSALQYGAKAYSSSVLKRTIDTVDPNFITTIGQRQSLSFIDIKQMNFVYCSSNDQKINSNETSQLTFFLNYLYVCHNSLKCLHGGYPDPSGGGSRCDSCRCPDGFGSKLCNTVEPSKDGCSQELTATTSWQTISYNGINKKCNWLIKAPDNRRIRFKILSLNITCRETCRSFVEVKYKDNFEQTGSRHCCELPPGPMLSMTSELVVLYRVDSDSKPNSGFSGQYKIDTENAEESDKVSGPSATGPRTLLPSSPGQWEEWSTCSEKCGGCGFRIRRKKCPLFPSKYCTEKSNCNEQVCPNKDPVCSYPLNVPCRKQEKNVLGTKLSDDDVYLLKNPPDYAGGEIKIGPEIDETILHVRHKRSRPLPVRPSVGSTGLVQTSAGSKSFAVAQSGNSGGSTQNSAGPPKSSAGVPSNKNSAVPKPSAGVPHTTASPDSASLDQTIAKSHSSSSSSSAPVKTCTRNLQYQCLPNSPYKVLDDESSPCCKGYEQRGNVCSEKKH